MKQSGRWQDVFGTIKLHVQIFLRMNNLDVRNKSKTYLLTYLLTDLLTPWSRVLLENLTGSADSQEIPPIFGTQRFIIVLTSARHLSLS